MYQFIGIISDEKVPGLENILNYMNDNFCLTKTTQPSTNTIITLLNNNITKHTITHTILVNTKHIISNIIYTHINIITITKRNVNHITNNKSTQSFIYNYQHVINLKTDYCSKYYISNNYKSQVAYVENNVYQKA